jgi:hypothetical protein
MLSDISIAYAIIAGIFSIALIFYALKKKSEPFFVWALLFQLISWSGIEWAFWNEGYNMFTLVFEPIVPLASYFVGWCLFVIYLGETHFKRRDWVAFIVIVLLFAILAPMCMDCL